MSADGLTTGEVAISPDPTANVTPRIFMLIVRPFSGQGATEGSDAWPLSGAAADAPAARHDRFQA